MSASIIEGGPVLRALHLFAGIGGGAIGFKRAGFETVGAVDSDPGACRSLAGDGQIWVREAMNLDAEHERANTTEVA